MSTRIGIVKGISRSHQKLRKWEHMYCRLLFLYYPIAWYLHIPFTLALTSVFFIVGLFLYLNRPQFRRILFSWPLMIWLTLTFFHLFNGYKNHVPGLDYVDALHGLKIYSCIAVFTYWFQRDFWGTLKELLVTFSLYMVIALFVCDFGVEEGERMSGAIYATQLGQSVALIVIYLAMWAYHKRYPIVKTLLLTCIPLIFIILAQTRNPLAMVVIILVGYMFADKFGRKKVNLKRLVLVMSALALVFVMAFIALKDTNLGQRFTGVSSKYESSYQFEQYSTGTIFDSLVGDRLTYYVVGFSLFLKSPLTGIGLWNYRYVTGGDYPLHTEYMVHLCEGGIIAFVLWVLFELIVLKRVLLFDKDRGIKIIAFMGLGAILFCGLYAREFFYEFFYPPYGMILALDYFTEKKAKKPKKVRRVTRIVKPELPTEAVIVSNVITSNENN